MGVGCATWWYEPPRQEDRVSIYRVSRIVHGVAVPCYTGEASCVNNLAQFEQNGWGILDNKIKP